MIPGLRRTSDYDKDEKPRTVVLTEDGIEQVEEMLREAGMLAEGNLYDSHNYRCLHHVQQALRAHIAVHDATSTTSSATARSSSSTSSPAA